MGISTKGATVHVAIAAWPWGAYLGEEALENGIRVKISSYARHHVNVTMPRAKLSSTYANSIIANAEAVEAGYDEALLLDTNGFVAEGAGENLFLVKDGVIYEPEIASALTGITRASVIQVAKEFGMEVQSRRVTRDDIYMPTKPSSPAPPPKSPRSATSTAASSARQARPGDPQAAKALLRDRQRPGARIRPLAVTSKIPGDLHARESGQTKPIEVTAKDLPLHCPMPDAPLWARHPASSST
jgi:branched-chain amino acid aminotransferase